MKWAWLSAKGRGLRAPLELGSVGRGLMGGRGLMEVIKREMNGGLMMGKRGGGGTPLIKAPSLIGVPP